MTLVLPSIQKLPAGCCVQRRTSRSPNSNQLRPGNVSRPPFGPGVSTRSTLLAGGAAQHGARGVRIAVEVLGAELGYAPAV